MSRDIPPPAARSARTRPDPPPRPAAERAAAPRWALELSPIAGPKGRQATLTTALAPWQPAIRRYLAWRLGMAALRDALGGAARPAGEQER